MAAGSLLLVGLFYISRLAPLQTLNWMIRNMLVYVAFAAIVIFQSDIRRALAHFGQAPFFFRLLPAGIRQRDDRGARGGGHHALAAADRRDHRDRA